MKRKLLFLIGLSSAIYATQEISCVDFVNLSKVKAKSYLDNYRKEFELNHFKTKGYTDRDKAYIGMQRGMSKHLLRCINLRRVTYYGVGDVRRALILTSLSKKILTSEEQSIYQKSLQENIAHYQAYSNSSVIANAQYMPLVYLTIERSKDNQHYIIYEFRKNGAVIQRYSKKILIKNPLLQLTTKDNYSNQNYLAYLNSNQTHPRLKIYQKPIKVKKFKRKIKRDYSSDIDNRNLYRVVKQFQAIKLSDKNTYIITTEYYPKKLYEEKNKVYFKESGEEYFTYKTNWNNGTKKDVRGKQ